MATSLRHFFRQVRFACIFERIVSVLQVPQENFACAGVERKSHDMTLAGPSWQFGERLRVLQRRIR